MRVSLVFFFLFTFTSFIVSQGAPEFKPEHSFKQPFYFVNSGSLPFWSFGGSTVATDKFVRLTPNFPSRAGWAFNVAPANMVEWSIMMKFHVGGGGSHGGDGFALWYVDKPVASDGPVFGAPDGWKGLAILFDTFDNDHKADNPRITAVMNDGRHIFRSETDSQDIAVASCFAAFRDRQSSVLIKYTSGILELDVDTSGRNDFKKCFSVALNLPQGYYFGLSSHTGDLFDNHDIHQFLTYDLVPDARTRVTPAPSPPPYQNQAAATPSPISPPREKRAANVHLEELIGKLGDFKSREEFSVQGGWSKYLKHTAPDSPHYKKAPDNFNFLMDLHRQIQWMMTEQHGNLNTMENIYENVTTDKNQLEAQHKEFAHHFSGMLKNISTKSDIEDLLSKKAQEGKITEIEKLRKVAKELHDLLGTVKSENEKVIESLNKFQSTILSVKSTFTFIESDKTRLQLMMTKTVHDLKEAVHNNTGFGWMGYFLIIQALCGSGVLIFLLKR
eukprot:TRINITY_DN2861_c0_g1_i1.p1 TRINITY_DN2861_c0_g1~~TRINITY_DN2861_c0_g1_i1.p1  ORF type:complete len:501 (-),score=152.21 TRINITY_DN2861_c0_g1_i1:202-1704(-)